MGAHVRIRTEDLILTKNVLYRLSYMGKCATNQPLTNDAILHDFPPGRKRMPAANQPSFAKGPGLPANLALRSPRLCAAGRNPRQPDMSNPIHLAGQPATAEMYTLGQQGRSKSRASAAT